MNCTAILLSLGLMGMVCSSPCDPQCKYTTKYHTPDFKHVSELQHSSVAPWNISVDAKPGREPAYIQYAKCKDCTVEHMIAKPIILQVSVYQMIIRKDDGRAWCRCPFDLAVGCTCVKKQ